MSAAPREIDVTAERALEKVLRSVPHVCLTCPHMDGWRGKNSAPDSQSTIFLSGVKCTRNKSYGCRNGLDDDFHQSMRAGKQISTVIPDFLLAHDGGPPWPEVKSGLKDEVIKSVRTSLIYMNEGAGRHYWSPHPSHSADDLIQCVAAKRGLLPPLKPLEGELPSNQTLTPTNWATW